MKKIFLVGVLISVCVFSGCNKSVVATPGIPGDYHQRIGYREERHGWWRDIIPSHASSSRLNRILTIDGVDYQDIGGWSPYYLEIPGTSAIIFVTSITPNPWVDSPGSAMHFYDFKTKRHIRFEPVGSIDRAFDSLGSKDPTQNTTVELFDGVKLVVLEKGPGVWTRGFFNLESQRILKMEVFIVSKIIDRNPTYKDSAVPVFESTNVIYWDSKGKVYIPQELIDDLNRATK